MKIDAWGTHLPLLVRAVVMTEGPVIELGCGLYSTPVLHALCAGKRPLVSVESNPEWAARFSQYERDGHEIIVGDWREPVSRHAWAVALVDHAPAADRAPAVRALKGRCRVIVCHDSEHRLYGLEPALADFAHRVEWKRYAPWTTAVSDIDALQYMHGLL